MLIHSLLTTKIDDDVINSSSNVWDGHGFIAQNPVTGMMVHVHRTGSDRPAECSGSKIEFVRSADKGKTWKNLSGDRVSDTGYNPTTILEAPTGWDYNNFNGGYTPTGRLIIMGRRMIYPFDAANKVFNFIIYSDDDGILWTPEIELEISGPDLHTWGVNSPLIILDNGEIAIAGAGAKYTTFVSVYTFKTLILKSDDNGVTWTGKLIHSRESSANSWKATEPSICGLGSGYILCISRDEGTNKSNSYRQFISNDYGDTWTELGVTEFVTITGTKRPAIIYPIKINGVKLVACYFGVSADKKVKVVYGLARDLIEDETAWDNNTIIELYTGSYANIGYQTAVHEPDGIDSIVAITDELSSSSTIKIIHLDESALGKIITNILS